MTIETYDAWLTEVQEHRDAFLLGEYNSLPSIQQLEESDSLWAASDAVADAPFIQQLED